MSYSVKRYILRISRLALKVEMRKNLLILKNLYVTCKVNPLCIGSCLRLFFTKISKYCYFDINIEL